MMDIGWTEMLVIAIVMIVVVGPKDLPRMLRTIGKFTAKARSMAGDFQRQFNEALKEAELDEVKKSVDDLRSLNPANQMKQQLNPFQQAAADVRAGLDQAMKPKPSTSAEPAASISTAVEPLKNGAAPLVGDGVDQPPLASPPPELAVQPAANPTVALGAQFNGAVAKGQDAAAAPVPVASATAAKPARARAKPAPAKPGAGQSVVAHPAVKANPPKRAAVAKAAAPAAKAQPRAKGGAKAAAKPASKGRARPTKPAEGGQ